MPSPPSANPASLIACHDCDLLHRPARLHHGERARCRRCRRVLQPRPRDVVTDVLALSLASFALLVMATVYPFMNMSVAGRSETSHLLTGMAVFYDQGYWELTLALGVVSVGAPLLVILGLLYLTVPLKLGVTPPAMPWVIRAVSRLRPWSMMEVYLLGVIVSWVKMSQMADLTFGPAAYAFVALIVTLTAALAAFDPAVLWARVELRR